MTTTTIPMTIPMTTIPMTMTMTMTTVEQRRHRRVRIGIRTRVVLGYVGLLAAALGISILVTHQVLLARLDREIERAFAQEVEELRLLADGTDPATGQPFGTDAAAIFDVFLKRSVPAENEAFYTVVDGRPYFSSFDAPPAVFTDEAIVAAWTSGTGPQRATVDTAVGEMRYLATPLVADGETTGVFVVAHFPEIDRREILDVVRVLLIAGGVVLVISGALAWSLAGRVLRPVRELTAAARGVTDTDLSRRIPVEGDDELAELTTTFNDMVERLEVSFVHQRQFLDDVAHELRTPITIAQGHLDLLGDDPDERAETVAVITDELDRMNRYVNDLLLLATAEVHAFLHLGPIDLADLVEAVEQKVDGLDERRWVIDMAPRAGELAIIGDRDRLVQAVLNLAANAVQHTESGDEIGIGVAADGPAATPVRIWIRDTGPGIEPAAFEQLFQRRFRGAASRSRRAEGMGIGLSIVDAIARAHGGYAAASHETDGGARFTIHLPIEPPEEPSR
ncbi:MAG: HAMP domain-containing sensor histidine kinase [Ilumatobacteraceae bacterium]|nr:HAMP domain-containing sensor histidine kinase [Ilumatobacteraceae bacterium]